MLIRVWVSGEKSFAFQRLPRAMQVFYGIILGTKRGSKEEGVLRVVLVVFVRGLRGREGRIRGLEI